MDLETVVVAVVAAWVVVLTLVALGLVRQIGLITVRLDRDRGPAAVDDGLEIGEPVPEEVLSQVAVDQDSLGYLLILGAVCAPCRELVSDLRGRTLARPVTVLVSGQEDRASSISELLPPDVSVIYDLGDRQGDLAKSLRIATSPFAFEIQHGKVHGKAVLHGADHLLQFIQPTATPANGNANGALLHVQEVEAHAER
jgi:hypothetical protein